MNRLSIVRAVRATQRARAAAVAKYHTRAAVRTGLLAGVLAKQAKAHVFKAAAARARALF
jgi:hypothetical protein